MASSLIKTPPSRPLEQRMQSLRTANRIRKLRAEDKQRIKMRELDARRIIMNPPDYWQAARVSDVMLAVPGVGHTKVERMLRKLHIAPAKTLGGMTDAQRQRLCEALARYYPRKL